MKNSILKWVFLSVMVPAAASFAAEKFGADVSQGAGEIVEGTVTEVCQKKGCFMKVKNADGLERFVRFKDYGFFVPTSLVGKKVRMNAVTVRKHLSVEEQKHLLEDVKAPKAKVQAVQTPLSRDEWLASGVEVLPQ